MITETFVPINGYEGLYEISNLGNVKALSKYKGTNYSMFCPEIIMKQRDNGAGYLVVKLKKHGGSKSHYIHRLVAIYFVENPDNLPEVDHDNSDKSCNEFWNLKWTTRLGNEQKAWRVGEKADGDRHQSSKPILQIDSNGNLVERFPSATFAAKKGYNRKLVSWVARGVYKQAYGYKWEYEDVNLKKE